MNIHNLGEGLVVVKPLFRATEKYLLRGPLSRFPRGGPMILCSGAFDGLHAGHVTYLQAAKALCEEEELLVCAVAPDQYIVTAKGRSPHWPQVDRVRTVHALAVVDAVLMQGPLSVAPLIHEYRPRLLVKGQEWADRLPEEVLQACQETGTGVAYVEAPGRHVQETLPLSDEAALAQFETLVLSQQPASAPWRPVTDYSFEARKAIEGPHAALIQACFQPDRVLDVGCGPGHLVRLLRESGVQAFGSDIAAPSTAEPWQNQIPYCFRASVLDEPVTTLNEPVPLVICREVLEHLTLRQIRQAVTNLCRLSNRFVYVTARFAPAPPHLLTVETADDLDPTHISLTNQYFLRMLFVLEGFTRRADLETRLDWQHQGRVLVYERT